MKHHVTITSFGRHIASFEADLSENEVLDLETSINWHASLLRVWIRPVEVIRHSEPIRVKWVTFLANRIEKRKAAIESLCRK